MRQFTTFEPDARTTDLLARLDPGDEAFAERLAARLFAHGCRTPVGLTAAMKRECRIRSGLALLKPADRQAARRIATALRAEPAGGGCLGKAGDRAGAVPLVAAVEGRPVSTQIPLTQIQIDSAIQARAFLSDATVADYAEAMQGGTTLPPVVVFGDGEGYWLADGFHRAAAALQAGLTEIAADVREGSRRDAVLFAAGANATHGLRRTNADKRRAVEMLLADEEWRQWSDSEIARRCGVSQPFVGRVRATTYNGCESAARRGADGRTINTERIGRSRGSAAAVAEEFATWEPHEIAECYPPFTEEEYRGLLASIAQMGVLMPVTLYEGQILDGRFRVKAAKELAQRGVEVEVPYQVHEGDFESAVALTHSMNLRRTHLSPSQKAAITVRLTREEELADAEATIERGLSDLEQLGFTRKAVLMAAWGMQDPSNAGEARELLADALRESQRQGAAR